MSTVPDTFVLSTRYLGVKDRRLIKSLTMLLQRRLQHTWVVSDGDHHGDVTLLYPSQLEAPDTHSLDDTIVVLVCDYDEDPEQTHSLLRRPIRSEDYVRVLNQSLADHGESVLNRRRQRVAERKSAGFGQRIGRFFGALFGKTGRDAASTDEHDPVSRRKAYADFSDARRQPPDVDLEHPRTPARVKRKSRFAKRFIDPEAQRRILNVVLIGSSGVGKSTLVRTVSDTHIVSTDVGTVDSLMLVKSSTTVGIDYGEFKVSGTNTLLRLFGNPGQHRFHHVWNTTCPNADIFLILVDLSRADPAEDLFYYWTFAERFHRDQPVILGKTHFDVTGIDSIDERITREIFPEKVRVRSVIFDPRDPDSVRGTLSRIPDLAALDQSD